MPEGVGYSGTAPKEEAARIRQTAERVEQDRVTEATDRRLSEAESRKNNAAVEVRLSEEALKAEEGVQPRQQADTYEDLNRRP